MLGNHRNALPRPVAASEADRSWLGKIQIWVLTLVLLFPFYETLGKIFNPTEPQFSDL